MFGQICASILSTMTDRACVNHATVVLLEEKLQRPLLELHCHLHPLDGISLAVRSSLKALNSTISSKLYGTDCRAANLIYAISKLRYKAKGDPGAFKNFLKEHGLPLSTFPRYIGNRFHVLFHSAGAIYLHQTLLLKYLKYSCNNSTGLKSSAVEDLQNPSILLHLQVLGLWGKLLTGPWMAVFYTEDSKRCHLELVQHLKCALAFIARVEQTPQAALLSKKDAFGRPLIQDDTLASLLSMENVDRVAFNSVVAVIAKVTKEKMKLQLHEYLQGLLADPSEEIKKKAASAPVHNIWAERTLGIADALSKRAPNAQMSFLDSLTKSRMNKTLEWVLLQSEEEQEKMINFCVKEGKKYRDLCKQRKVRRDRFVTERQKVKSQQRDQARRNKLAREVKTVLENGTGLDSVLFQNIAGEQLDKLVDYFASFGERSNAADGIEIEHLWNVRKGNVLEDVQYKGRILKSKTKKTEKILTISYWTLEEGEEGAVDSNVNFKDFCTDLILGDLQFC
ncbi:uncharacterized protein LOC118478527 [Aplysia californica]|uniref:Uncharacterized protein LOC118478527 n=1 Tax=Aplysia californica TaxID=6500 RepID=A0ABM1W0M0_APLCA|nr:uncharacterized protein LOC118478527 [Aplysia californica]